MSILSLDFLAFCLVLLALYYTVCRRCQWVLLLIGSAAFYALTCEKYAYCVLISLIATYGCTMMTDRLYKSGIPAKEAKKRARLCLLALLGVNIGILFVMKYLGFFCDTANRLLGLFGQGPALPVRQLIMPLGLSFYTFAIVGYALDVYWKRIGAEKNFFKLALFTLYFPHILQGPIARYSKLAPQFAGEKRLDADRAYAAVLLTVYGFFKKLVIANRIELIVGPFFDNFIYYPGWSAIPALCLYSVELYADFSGCMDIISGISALFGIELDKNFRRPFFSQTIPEFWQRWHITLGVWFKDYVLFPVSVSRLEKKINRFTSRRWSRAASRVASNMLPLLCVWLLTGLWHGASGKFLVWGMYYFFLLAGALIFEKPLAALTEKLRINTASFAWRLFRMARTFLLCSLGRAFFRADSLVQALSIIKRMLLWRPGTESIFPDPLGLGLCLAGVAVLLCVSVFQEKEAGGCATALLRRQPVLCRWAVWFILIVGTFVFGVYGMDVDTSAFAYAVF